MCSRYNLMEIIGRTYRTGNGAVVLKKFRIPYGVIKKPTDKYKTRVLYICEKTLISPSLRFLCMYLQQCIQHIVHLRISQYISNNILLKLCCICFGTLMWYQGHVPAWVAENLEGHAQTPTNVLHLLSSQRFDIAIWTSASELYMNSEKILPNVNNDYKYNRENFREGGRQISARFPIPYFILLR